MSEEISIVRNMLQLTATPKEFENRKYHHEFEENGGRLILPGMCNIPNNCVETNVRLANTKQEECLTEITLFFFVSQQSFTEAARKGSISLVSVSIRSAALLNSGRPGAML